MTLRTCVATIMALVVIAMTTAAAGVAAAGEEPDATPTPTATPTPIPTPAVPPAGVTVRTVSDRILRTQLKAAIAAFNAARARVYLRFATTGEHPDITLRYGHLKEGVAGLTTVACRTDNMPCKTEGDAKIVISTDKLADATLKVVVAHELGHALGLDHSDPDGPCSVMTPSADHSGACNAALVESPVRPTDAQALRRIWGGAG